MFSNRRWNSSRIRLASFSVRTDLRWFGGLIAGIAAFVYLGRKFKIPILRLFDIASPACALGYGIGRIGCLFSGDGDYGIPTSLPWGMSFPNGLVPTTERVHPTPIYEFLVALLITWFLWRLGAANAAASARSANAATGTRVQRSPGEWAWQECGTLEIRIDTRWASGWVHFRGLYDYDGDRAISCRVHSD